MNEGEKGTFARLRNAEISQIGNERIYLILGVQLRHQEARSGNRLVRLGVPYLARQKCLNILDDHYPWS
jgi:hypothetical protein